MSSYTYFESSSETEGDCSPTLQTKCFACGRENSHGLQISYKMQYPGKVSAEWCPGRGWEGFDGVVHGGIVTTALDEAMAKAIVSTETMALTCELKVRFRHSVHPGDELSIQGWIVDRRRRLVHAEASISDRGGEEFAHAWAIFLIENGAHPHHAW